jgi:hypothetical protein
MYFTICDLIKFNRIKLKEPGGTRGTYGKLRGSVGVAERKRTLRSLGVVGRIILKRNLQAKNRGVDPSGSGYRRMVVYFQHETSVILSKFP